MASFFSTVKKINKVASTISSVKSVTNAVRSGSNRSITSSVLDIADKQRNVNSQINDISGFKSSFSLNGITAPSLGSFASFGSLGGRVNNILSAALELEGIVNSPIRLLSRGADEIYDLTGGRFDTSRKQVENLSQITAFDKFINNNFSDPRDPIKKTGASKSRIPNPLRDYSSYNYKITLGILSNSEYNNPESYRSRGFETYIIKGTGGDLGKRTQVDQEMIATPSGHGEYFIEDLTYEGVVAPNPATGVTLGTTLNFKVVEPFSMGNFVESITVAAKLSNNGKGYKSYFKAPFCIRIDFSGWIPESTYSVSQPPIYLPIMITKMDMRVTGQGSEYDVSAVAFSEQALSDHANKAYTQIKAVGTFAHEVLQTGDKSVASALNKRIEKLEDSNIIPGYDRFIICFPKNSNSISTYLKTGVSKPEDKTALQSIVEAKGSSVDPKNMSKEQLEDYFGKLNRKQSNTSASATKPVTGMFETLLAFAEDQSQMNEIGKSPLIKESTAGGDQAMASMSGTLQSEITPDTELGDLQNQFNAGADITEDFDNPCGPELVPQPGLNEKDAASSQTAEFARQYAFQKDEKIVTIIEKVLLNSEFCKASASEDGDENGIRRWFRIDTQTFLEENSKTEEALGRPPMVYVFAIYPYEADEAKFLGPNEVPKNTAGLRESAAKEYNYLYTGSNEDVLGFDIQFNTSFMRTAMGNYGNNAGSEQTGTANKKVIKSEQPANAKNVAGETTPAVEQSGEARSAVQEVTQNPTGNASRDSDIRRLIAENFHNILIHQPSDMISVSMDIMGDPFFLPQDIGNHHSEQSGSSPNATTEGTMLYTKGEVFVVVNFRTPFDYEVSGASMEMPLIVPQFSGLFTVYKVTNTFSNGQYKQTLKLVRRVGQDTPATSNNKGIMAIDNESTYQKQLPGSDKVLDEQKINEAGSPINKSINQAMNLLEQGANSLVSSATSVGELAFNNLSAVNNISNTGANAAGAIGKLNKLGSDLKNTAEQSSELFSKNAKFDANKFKAGIPAVNLQTSGNAAFDLSAAINQALLVAVPSFGAFQIDTSTPAGKLGLLASELQGEFDSALGAVQAPDIIDATNEFKKQAKTSLANLNLSPSGIVRTRGPR